MPRLFNAENCLFATIALTSLASDASQTATMAGITTNDYVAILYNDDMQLTTESGFNLAVSAADTLVFTPSGCSGAASAIAQTVGILGLKAPASGADGGSW